MQISIIDRLRIWLITGNFPPPLPTAREVFMTVKFDAQELNRALDYKLHPVTTANVGVIVSSIVNNNNSRDNAKLALFPALRSSIIANQNPQKAGNPINENSMNPQEVAIGSQFYNNTIDFDFVFFPTLEIQRLLSVSGAQGLEFTKTYCVFSGQGGKDVVYQNLVATPYPNGFFEQAKAGAQLMGNELTEYSYGFACPPIWHQREFSFNVG